MRANQLPETSRPSGEQPYSAIRSSENTNSVAASEGRHRTTLKLSGGVANMTISSVNPGIASESVEPSSASFGVRDTEGGASTVTSTTNVPVAGTVEGDKSAAATC
jgi:hypothetical protein